MGLIFVVISCKPQTGVKTSSQITADGSDMETITLKLKGNGSNILESQNNAVLAGFDALMFQGIPQTSFNKPLIDNKVEFLKNHKTFFEQNINPTLLVKYVSSINTITKFSKSKSGSFGVYEITINVASFKSFLESNGVLRKFGF